VPIDREAGSNPEVIERTVFNGGLGIVPISNKYGGHVSAAIEHLIEHRESLTIIGSIQLQIQHVLCGNASHMDAPVERIYSHPQALTQCQNVLQERYPQAQLLPTESTTQ